jgi:hypothetical protein
MVSLVDIVPQTRTVQLAAGELELRGLGLRQIADLFVTFPGLRNFLVEGAPNINATEIIRRAPDAIGTIVALCAGQPDAAKAIVDAGSGLTPDDLLDCLEVIFELTFPRGLGPFLERAAPLLAVILHNDGADPSGRDLDMSVPQQPSNSSLQDTSPVQ